MRGGLLSSIACIIFSFSIFGCNTNTASSELVAVLDIPENVTVDTSAEGAADTASAVPYSSTISFTGTP